MTGFWPIFFLLVVLKIPVLGSLWLVWWASQQTPEPEGAEDSDGGFKRRAASTAATRPAPRAPRRRRRDAAATLPAGRAHPGRQTR